MRCRNSPLPPNRAAAGKQRRRQRPCSGPHIPESARSQVERRVPGMIEADDAWDCLKT